MEADGANENSDGSDIEAGHDELSRRREGLIEAARRARSAAGSGRLRGLWRNAKSIPSAVEGAFGGAKHLAGFGLRWGKRSLEEIADAIGGSAAQARELLDSASETARQVAEKGRARVFRETTVPVYLLPTGPGPRDFDCCYSFQAALDQLRSGVLVKPSLQVWAGRSDIDRDHLAHRLQKTFTEGMRRERRAVGRSGRQLAAPARKEIRKAEARMDDAGKRIGKATGWVGASAVAMLFATNPLFDLVFLLLAVTKGADGLRHAWSYVAHSVDIAKGERGVAKAQRELKKLSDELERRGDAIREAMSNIDLFIHPQLRQLVADFSEVEGLASPIEVDPPERDSVPDLREQLSEPWYRRQVADYLHPLIDAL